MTDWMEMREEGVRGEMAQDALLPEKDGYKITFHGTYGLYNNLARLLAVARAAYIYDYCMDEDTERKERLLLIMRAALADVEDLL